MSTHGAVNRGVSLVSVPSEESSATCANCGAALVADQRYCLACGQPCSPVRLAFLDVLNGEQPQLGAATATRDGWVSPGTIEMSPVGYVPLAGQGANGWLRRHSGLLGLLTVLLMCLIVGLLVGHWVTQSNKSNAPQVIKIEGLSAAPAAAAAAGTTPTSTAPATGASPAASKTSAKEEAEEATAEAKETKAEKAPPPKPVQVAPSKLKKLSSTTGKQHAEEVNALGAQPIETGG
jgi:hypothetical protein